MGDRANLDLIGRQEELVRAMIGTGKPVIVFLFSLAFAATAGCLLFYGITKEANRKIADDLDERRKKYGSAMA